MKVIVEAGRRLPRAQVYLGLEWAAVGRPMAQLAVRIAEALLTLAAGLLGAAGHEQAGPSTSTLVKSYPSTQSKVAVYELEAAENHGAFVPRIPGLHHHAFWLQCTIILGAIIGACQKAIERLRAYNPPPANYYSVPHKRQAAVLLLLFADRTGDLRVILTIRSNTLKSFPGQAALPGGKSDSPSETPFETARREANEEIGLPNIDQDFPSPFWVEHLCELPTNLARTELVVRPCVALLHSYNHATGEDADPEEAFMPQLDAKEVAAVFSAPFHNFLKMRDEPRGVEDHDLPGEPTDWYDGTWTDWNTTWWRMHHFFVPITNQTVTKSRRKSIEQEEAVAELEKDEISMGLERYRVFGMTARIMVDAARVAYDEEPEFEHNSHFGDEDMISRLRRLGRFSEEMNREDVLTQEIFEKASKLT